MGMKDPYLAAERRNILMQRGKLIIEPLNRPSDVLLHGFLRDHLRRPTPQQGTPSCSSPFSVILPDIPNKVNFIPRYASIWSEIENARRNGIEWRENSNVRNLKVDYATIYQRYMCRYIAI